MFEQDIINGVTGADGFAATPELFESRVRIPGHTERPAGVKATPVERARGLLRGLMLVLHHHDAPKKVLDSFQTQVMAYLVHEDETIFFNRAKFLTTDFQARYLKCERPKSPDLAFEPKGQFRNWARTRLRVFCRKNTHLWYSFLQAKRSALPLSSDLVLATYEKHRKAMEVKDPIDTITHDTVMKELEPVLKKIRNGVRRLYDTDARDDLITRREVSHGASTRAAYENPRSKGGQSGWIRSRTPHVESCNPLNPTRQRTLPDLIRMVFHPVVVRNGTILRNVVLEEYAYVDGEKFWLDRILRETLCYVGGRRLNATIQAVLEPLKVRVISKGEAIPYYISKPLQRAMHDVMRRMDCFRLIGRPLCPTDLIDCAENRTILGEGRYEWFSIDYSAATDNLSARLSASIMASILEGQDEDLQNIWRSVLAPHHCRYPLVSGEQVKSVDQQNGQLMGSILSFPILCLANLGLYLANIKEDSRPLRDKLKGVLVNGDDMLYVARHSKWADHVSLGEKVGLVMSPGKAYYHPVYANANSACFHYDLYQKRSIPWSIPFLNSGLYFGQSKVLGGDDEDGNTTISSTINRLLQGSLPGKQCDVLRQFLARHSKTIESECKGRNLFVDPALGGIGIDPPVGWNPQFTLVQRVEARRRLEAEHGLYLGIGPAVGPAPREASQPLRAPWLVPESAPRPSHLRGWRGAPRLLKKSLMTQRTHLCVVPRDGDYRVSRPVRFDPRSDYFRDMLREEASGIDAELNSYIEETAETLSWLRTFC